MIDLGGLGEDKYILALANLLQISLDLTASNDTPEHDRATNQTDGI